MHLPAALAAAIAVTGIAAWHDHRTGEIPDWVSLPALAIAPAAYLVTGLAQAAGRGAAFEAAGWSMLGAVGAASLPFLLFRARAIGGGDVKLLASLGAICMTWGALQIQLHAFLIAFLMAIPKLVVAGQMSTVLRRAWGLAIGREGRDETHRDELESRGLTVMRLGPAIFLATCFELYLTMRGRS